MHNLKPVLLVEDDDVDAITIRRAIEEIDIPNRLIHVTDGEQALEYLRDSSSKKPCVILLDLNMPKMNGIEFLKIAKNDDVLKQIPVVVLTTSKQERDIVETFSFSVAGYILKCIDYQKFVETLKTVNLYWSMSELPA